MNLFLLNKEKKTKNLSNNYGFRPGHSPWTAVEKLKQLSQRCNIIIEGDIVSAYNNVDHAILLKILRERIADKKFLRLIKDLLKSGVMDNNKFEHSLNGIPQRGIVSPLLFNIYMLGFDQYVYEEFIVPILKENERKPKRERPSSEYNKAKYLTEKALKNLKKFKKNIVTKTNVTKVKELLKEFKRVRALRNNISYAN
jgi:retron-type reverse transcriptase